MATAATTATTRRRRRRLSGPANKPVTCYSNRARGKREVYYWNFGKITWRPPQS